MSDGEARYKRILLKLSGEALGAATEAKPQVRVRVGVSEKEPVVGDTRREDLPAELGNRTCQQVVLERARAIKFGEQPVAAGWAHPIGDCE